MLCTDMLLAFSFLVKCPSGRIPPIHPMTAFAMVQVNFEGRFESDSHKKTSCRLHANPG